MVVIVLVTAVTFLAGFIGLREDKLKLSLPMKTIAKSEKIANCPLPLIANDGPALAQAILERMFLKFRESPDT
jgi:hypothetical protein